MKKKLLAVIKHLLKAIIFLGMMAVLGISWAITAGISPLWFYLYGTVVIIALGAFGLSYCQKYRKIAYIVWGMALVVFILMGKYVPEIKEQHDIDACMDSGKVYDPIQKICRDDCLTWSKETGCVPIQKK